MQQKKIYIWLAGISLLLILLISIQLVWLRSATRLEQKETAMYIQRALEKTENEVKKNTYCFEMYSKGFVGANEGIYIVRQKVDSNGYTGKPDTLNLYMNIEGYMPDTQIYKSSSLSMGYPFSAEIRASFTMEIRDTGVDVGIARAAHENFTGKRFRDVLSNKKAIDSIFSMKVTDSILKKCLADERISTDYGFAFISDDDNKIVFAKRVKDSSSLLASPYQMKIFADNKFVKQHRLAILFAGPVGTNSGNYWLYASIAIIAVLSASFYFFVRLYIKQTRLSEMKSDFINNLTHEFNTPMANISLAIETLSEQNHTKDPKVERIFNIISAESDRLQENIERALQVATMEKGNLHLRKEEVDLVAIVNTIMSAYQLQSEQVKGTISFTHPPQCLIYADETHLLNCICNLLDNSIKYRQGPPRINIHIEEKDNEAILTVTDNGKGMNNETQKHIFKKFYRAHEGDLHDAKGFGLGLCYVKGIIDSHTGKISVWSKPGTGTKFTITLPKNISYEQLR